jgi:hypothetical protein
MAPKCCSKCAHTFPLTSFLKDPSNPKSKSLSFCIQCRTKATASFHKCKRKALKPLEPNIPSKRPAIANTKPRGAPSIPPPLIRSATRLEPSICPFPLLESRPQSPLHIPPIPESPLQPPPLQPAGFLPADQWSLIQDFHTTLDKVKIKYCLRCRERWFSMGLRNGTCDACFLKDKSS